MCIHVYCTYACMRLHHVEHSNDLGEGTDGSPVQRPPAVAAKAARDVGAALDQPGAERGIADLDK